jgi:hypothetical protein
MTMSGVPKPAYRALAFIADAAAAGQAVLPVSGGERAFLNTDGANVGASSSTVDVAVTVGPARGGTGRSTVTALVANYNISSGPTPSPVTISLVFSGSAGSTGAWPATATLELCDATHGNPMAVWTQAGSPTYPAADEIAEEMAASVLPAETIALTTMGDGTALAVITLEPYAFARLRFTTL